MIERCWLLEKQIEKQEDVTKASHPIPDDDFAKAVVKHHLQSAGNPRVKHTVIAL